MDKAAWPVKSVLRMLVELLKAVICIINTLKFDTVTLCKGSGNP